MVGFEKGGLFLKRVLLSINKKRPQANEPADA